LGGQQTARSLHFLVTILLVLFLLIHVLMVFLAGFRNRMRAMISGNVTSGNATSEKVTTGGDPTDGLPMD
jgi:cytochrome b subunit of formate dehydrogenase